MYDILKTASSFFNCLFVETKLTPPKKKHGKFTNGISARMACFVFKSVIYR